MARHNGQPPNPGILCGSLNHPVDTLAHAQPVDTARINAGVGG